MKYKFVRLKSGWGDEDFEKKLNELTEEMSKEDWSYYDIKITSNGDNSLVIFNKSTRKILGSYPYKGLDPQQY